MSTFEATLEQLPKPILNKLQSIIWRVRRLLFIRGIFATLAIGLACLLGIMAIDASVTIFSNTVRWGLSLTGLVITVFAGWWFLIRPLSRKLSLTHVARILEVRHPELQERISTAVELLSSDDPEEIKGSEELIKAVVDSAVLDVESVDPRKEFKGGRAARFVQLALVFAAVIGLVLFVFPDQGMKLLARAVAPFLNIGNAYADTMVVKPGNAQVAIGSEVTIEMTIQHDKIRRAELRRVLDDGTESVERMTFMGKTEEGAQRFSITFPSLQDSFNYRVRAGVALSEYYQIDAIPPPVIENLSIRYDYPEYTQLEPREVNPSSGEIRAVANTEVSVAATINKEVWAAKAILNDHRELGDTIAEGSMVTSKFLLNKSTNGTWRLDIEDLDKFSSERKPHPIQTLPDKAPIVRVTNPIVRELRLKPVEVLPISFEINEDFGFKEVAILVTPNGDANPWNIVQPTPERTGNSNVWNGQASLNLASLDLEDHQNRLQVQIRALDNLPEKYDGPNEGISETITIVIDRNAKSLAEQTIEAQKRELENAIREAKKDLDQARSNLQTAERELARREEISETADKSLERFREDAKEAEKTLTEVAEKLKNSVFQPQAKALEEIAEEEIANAQESADLIPMTDDKQERVRESREAKQEIEQALNDLKKVEDSIRESRDEYEAIAQLNEMANNQRELARDAAERAEQLENSPNPNEEQQRQQQEQAMQDFQRRQEDVQEDLGEMLKDNAAALEEILENRREEADRIAEAASELAEKQKALRETTEAAAKSQQNPQQEEALAKEIMNQLQRMQEQIAQETKDLQKDLANQEKSDPSQQNQGKPQENNQNPQSPPALTEAAEQTQDAAESLAEEKMAEARETAQKAAEKLAEAAQQASEPQSQSASAESQPSQPDQSASSEMAQNQAGEEAAADPQTAENADSPAPAQSGQQESAPSEMADAESGQPQSQDGEPGGETPQSSPEPSSPEMQAAAEALTDLAERQEAIAEQIAAVESGNLQEALSMMEEQFAAESSNLQADAQALEETLENLQQRQSRYEANHAANFLKSASRQAEQAQQDLNQAQQAQQEAESKGQVPEGQMAPQTQQSMARSQQDQAQAQRSMETAARSLQQASQAIGQTLDGLKPSESDERLSDSQQMAESFEDVTQSAQSQTPQEAAQRSQQAAESLQQLAQQAMQQLGNMGQEQQQSGQQQQQPQPGQQNPQMTQNMPGDQPNQGQKAPDGIGEGIPPELRDLGFSAKDWARFKGTLTGGSATAIDTNLPEEYRELVGRYFQVIAKEADKK